MSTIHKELGNPITFLDKVFSYLKTDKIDISKYQLDHLCYRVETFKRYNDLKLLLGEKGSNISEVEVNGRPIAIFKLNQPVVYKNRKIYCIELPAPTPEKPYSEGWQHVEFVINKSLKDFISEYPHKKFKTRDQNLEINPTIALEYDTLTVKFHLYDIEYVVTVLQKNI